MLLTAGLFVNNNHQNIPVGLYYHLRSNNNISILCPHQLKTIQPTVNFAAGQGVPNEVQLTFSLLNSWVD